MASFRWLPSCFHMWWHIGSLGFEFALSSVVSSPLVGPQEPQLPLLPQGHCTLHALAGLLPQGSAAPSRSPAALPQAISWLRFVQINYLVADNSRILMLPTCSKKEKVSQKSKAKFNFDDNDRS